MSEKSSVRHFDSDVADALMRAVLADPFDLLPRLVLADWLDENDRTGRCPSCPGLPGKVHRPYPGGWDGCGDCSGTGWRSNGFAARAEFVRLDCETHEPGVWHERGCRLCELFDRHRDEWFPVPVGFGFDWDITRVGSDRSHAWIVGRGFVEGIRCPLGWWAGEVCEQCAGGVTHVTGGAECPHCGGRSVWRSGVHFDNERRCVSSKCGHSWEPGTRVAVRCASCSGTGRTPGHGAEVVSRHPVTKVVVTDRGPADRSEVNGCWYWFKDESIENPYFARQAFPDAILPSVLFERMAGKPTTIGLPYPSREAAVGALSDALVDMAREKAGLRQLVRKVEVAK